MNSEIRMSLDEAVAEVLGLLTGLDLSYEPELDRYRAITRQLNRALRANALDNEWSHYADVHSLGWAQVGQSVYMMSSSIRPRITNDDAVRLVDANGVNVRWAYFLPRDALHKYQSMEGLWCSVVRDRLEFSRPLMLEEQNLEIQVPVMREPRMFRLPGTGTRVAPAVRNQPIDFAYPDLIIARAAFFYAQTDPVMQPRVPQLEDGYKNLMYQLIERDTSITDTPYINETVLPLHSGLSDPPNWRNHLHPHANAN